MKSRTTLLCAAAIAFAPLAVAGPSQAFPSLPPVAIAFPDTTARSVTAVVGDQPGTWFGVSVAVSGPTMAVGAELEGTGGAVHLYNWNGTTWAPAVTLPTPDPCGLGEFGRSLALQGNTLVVGAPSCLQSEGRAYVYTGSGTQWTEQAVLVSPSANAAQSKFGMSVAVDGNTVVVGARDETVGALKEVGAVYVFNRTGSTFDSGTMLVDSQRGDSASLGASVGIASGTILAGAPENSSGAAGRVAVFTGGGTNWVQQPDLAVPIGLSADGHFGYMMQVTPSAAYVAEPGLALGTSATFPENPKLFVFNRSGSGYSYAKVQSALTDGPMVGYSADSFFQDGATIYAGVEDYSLREQDQVTTSPGAVLIWGPEQPLTAALSPCVQSVPAPGVLANDWSPVLRNLGFDAATAVMVPGSASAAGVTLNPDGSFSFNACTAGPGKLTFQYQLAISAGLLGQLQPDKLSGLIYSQPTTVTINVPTVTYTLNYAAGPNGIVSGVTTQTVAKGGSGSTVTAVANQGAQFTGWSDGVTTAARTDANVSGNLSVTAQFAQLILPVTASATSHKSKFKLQVQISTCPGHFSFQIQKRSASTHHGSDDPVTTYSWKNYGKPRLTSATTWNKTVNLPKGTWRAVVTGRCGYATAVSNEVALKK